MQPSSSGHAPLPSSRASKSSTLQNLLKLIANITVNDISGAERCGSGGFGDVYMLTHPAIGKLALKRVRISGIQQEIDSQLRRAAREAETWRGLDHPNILPFFDVLERSGCIYLVSPFVQNGSIMEFIRRHPDVDRARLIQEAAAGIAYIHRCGIIHGDIKGANILVSDDVRSLLCDFGLAREKQINTSTAMQDIGTVRWQSPELLSMARKTFKSDAWAFAMTISEILSGNFPYHECAADTAVIIAVFVLKQRPPKEPATSPTGASYALLWDVASDCWHDDPDQRPEMQKVYDRLILGSFRSLLLSPPRRDDEDTLKDAHVASPTNPSPPPISSDALHSIPIPSSTLPQAPVNSGPVETRIPSAEAMTRTVSDHKRTVELQTSLVQLSENTTASSAKPNRSPLTKAFPTPILSPPSSKRPRLSADLSGSRGSYTSSSSLPFIVASTKPTGYRRNVTPGDLIPLDAPTQHQDYVFDSKAAHEDLPLPTFHSEPLSSLHHRIFDGMSDQLPRLQLLTRLQESATTWASRARRNGQQLAMYADRCTEIVHDLDQSLRVERSAADEEYLQDFMAVSRLEVIMLTLHPTLVDEVGGLGPTHESCESWERNHLIIERTLRELHCEPFKASSELWQEDLGDAVKFDEWTWITRMLDMIISSFSKQIEEQISLVREIYSLETEFWARDEQTRKGTISAITGVLYSGWQEDRSPIVDAGGKFQRTALLKEALSILRELGPDSHSIQPSQSQSAPSIGSIPGRVPSASSASGPALSLNQPVPSSANDVGRLDFSSILQAGAPQNYFMQLDNLKGCGALDYKVETGVFGPGNGTTWRTTIHVKWTSFKMDQSASASDSFVGEGSSKKAAKNEAARSVIEFFVKRNTMAPSSSGRFR